VINKMDDPTVKWAKERFDECVSKLKPFLKSCGYLVKKDVKFIPVSGTYYYYCCCYYNYYYYYY